MVGVSTDALNVSKKDRLPIYSQDERLEIVSGLKWVDEVFLEESLGLKREYVEVTGASVLAMGSDWTGQYNYLAGICEVVYFPRTPLVSTTELIEHVARVAQDHSLARRAVNDNCS